ncbi:uncharacterized protein EURHEDRAFT_135489 [Aspergillus ruber CBS 135680]|uniref:Uncharacterized protein n=1 Tax=Aspergillus ruber (strain CBS 135680) TaxID=1388766 RepID=A0A017SSP4_ASPRC|nr:uncharacterized protein EURHEDRAFT_135489 [Aspergillus ruber CBS 135680]EYE99310.1 hypothetical protein EURHEDRAFT_135489 [Aspergillus ruber CBS 135680]
MKVVSLSPGRHVTMLCDKLVFAAGLTSEPNMPEISGLNWTAGSMLHNVHAKDVGEYCRGHLGYHPVLDRFQRRRELEHIMNSTRCVLWRYTRQISLCLIFFYLFVLLHQGLFGSIRLLFPQIRLKYIGSFVTRALEYHV